MALSFSVGWGEEGKREREREEENKANIINNIWRIRVEGICGLFALFQLFLRLKLYLSLKS